MTEATTLSFPKGVADSPLTAALTAVRQLADRLGGATRPKTPIRSPVDAALAEATDAVLGDAVERLGEEIAAAERVIADQRARIAELERLATTDPLTGIANRRGFDAALARVASRAKREGENGVMIFIDLDDFKAVNDRHGHDAGDAVLREAARILRQSARDFDVVARLGGDEFAVILVGADVATGRRRAEQLYYRLNGTAVSWNGHRVALRASFGIEIFDGKAASAAVLARADAAMYRAKHGASAVFASAGGATQGQAEAA